MARLAASVPPGFEEREGEPFMAQMERFDAALDALEAKSRALEGDAVVGTVLRFPRADGYAVYLVSKEKPLTLQHVPVGDAWHADPILIRGLRKQDVLEQRERNNRLHAMFSRKRLEFTGTCTG